MTVGAASAAGYQALMSWWSVVNDPAVFHAVDDEVVELLGTRTSLAARIGITPGSLTDRIRRLERTGVVVDGLGRARLRVNRRALARRLGLAALPVPGPPARSAPVELHPTQQTLVAKIADTTDAAALAELARALTAITGQLCARPAEGGVPVGPSAGGPLAAELEESRPAPAVVAAVPRATRETTSCSGVEMNMNSAQLDTGRGSSRAGREPAPPLDRSEWNEAVAGLRAAWRERGGDEPFDAPHLLVLAGNYPPEDLRAALSRLEHDVRRNRPIKNIGALLTAILDERRAPYFAPAEALVVSPATEELAEAVATRDPRMPAATELLADTACRSALQRSAAAGVDPARFAERVCQLPWRDELAPLAAAHTALNQASWGTDDAAEHDGAAARRAGGEPACLLQTHPAIRRALTRTDPNAATEPPPPGDSNAATPAP